MDRRLVNPLGAAMLVAAALCGGMAAARPDPGYRVHLDRPLRVGEKIAVLAQGSVTRTLTELCGDRETTVERQVTTVSFDADSEILEVDGFGRPSCVDYIVNSLAISRDGGAVEAAPAGAHLRAVRLGHETYFELDGEAVEVERARVLELVAGLGRGRGLHGAIYDSIAPRRPGEQWDIDHGRAQAGLEDHLGALVEPVSIFGNATLVDVRNHENEPCLLIRSHLAGRHRIDLGSDRPFELNVAVRHQGLFPIDRRLPCLSDTWRMRTESLSRPWGVPEVEVEGTREVITTVIQRVARPDTSPDGPVPGPPILASTF